MTDQSKIVIEIREIIHKYINLQGKFTQGTMFTKHGIGSYNLKA